MWNYITITIITVLMWEILPIRKWFYLFKGSLSGKTIRVKLFYIKEIIQKHIAIIRFIVHFALFYFIFEWNNEFIKQKILAVVKKIINKLLKFKPTITAIMKKFINVFILVTPFRHGKIVSENFKYAFIICTICAFVGFLAYLFIVMNTMKKHKIVSVLVSIISFVIMWNVMYYACRIVSKIPIFYKVLALLAIIILSIITWIIIAIPFFYIIDTLED